MTDVRYQVSSIICHLIPDICHLKPTSPYSLPRFAGERGKALPQECTSPRAFSHTRFRISAVLMPPKAKFVDIRRSMAMSRRRCHGDRRCDQAAPGRKADWMKDR
jgi:hypothetical protein